LLASENATSFGVLKFVIKNRVENIFYISIEFNLLTHLQIDKIPCELDLWLIKIKIYMTIYGKKLITLFFPPFPFQWMFIEGIH
jgi:hypothetical protein